MNLFKYTIILFFFTSPFCYAQYEDFNTVKTKVDFNAILQEWDGFGVNYVQLAHSKDYSEYPQEYGGFSLLSEADKQKIIDMTFGQEGLKPGLLKMFLDPLHQKKPGGSFDHETTTKYLMEFAKMGTEMTRSRGAELQIVTTLYGPPAWATLQKELRGRDLDHEMKNELALYMIDWARFLKEENLPVKYISLHNEGEDWRRWAVDGKYANFDHGHDYNMYWRPEEVADFISFMPDLMQDEGLEDVGVTPGEPSRFYQFDNSGYARAIYDNPKALENISLITSHNFYRSVPGGHRWWAGSNNHGTFLLRSKRPDLKSWVTSASWGGDRTTVDFIWQIYMNIYQARVNGYIPWACIQRPEHWPGGDPNPSTAFKVQENGTFTVEPGYYFYKQVSRAGQPGMGIAVTESMDSEVSLLGFAKVNTDNPDAFVVVNNGVSVTYRADNVGIHVKDGYFRISTIDQTYNRDNIKDISCFAASVDGGYMVEAAIPWEEVNIDIQKEKIFDFNVDLMEGRYSIAGKMKWNDKGMINISSSEEASGSHVVSVKEGNSKPTIDGKDEAVWESIRKNTIETNDHPNTPENYGGYWKAFYDEKNLYVQVRVYDETNLQGKRLAISVPGTAHKKFKGIRTSEDGELYKEIGEFDVEDGKIIYEAPHKTVTTFFGQ